MLKERETAIMIINALVPLCAARITVLVTPLTALMTVVCQVMMKVMNVSRQKSDKLKLIKIEQAFGIAVPRGRGIL